MFSASADCLLRAVRPLLSGRTGSTATTIAIACPVLLTLTLGAVDYSSVVFDQGRLRAIAEAAALSGAVRLGTAMNEESALEHARAHAMDEIARWKNGPSTEAFTEFADTYAGRALRVRLDAYRPSLFGDLLPPGGWRSSVHAAAMAASSTPLCVIALETSKDKTINVKDHGSVEAPNCLLHSNRDVVVENSGAIHAGAVQAVTKAQGRINPSATSDAPELEDPFGDLPIGAPKCTGEPAREFKSGAHVLPAGLHCSDVKVMGTARLTLSPGEHWFARGALEVKEDAQLDGQDVVLLFDKDAKFEMKDRSSVTLDGRKSGVLSGFVIVAGRNNTNDFYISSDHVEALLGVIYIPSATLIVEGKSDVARESDWTVLVANQLQLKGNPALYMNTGYDGSDVPVPEGVGPRAGAGRLVE